MVREEEVIRIVDGDLFGVVKGIVEEFGES